MAKKTAAAKHHDKAAPVESVGQKDVHAETAHVEQPSILHNEYTWIGLAFVLTVVAVIKFLVPMINKGLDGRAAKIRDQLEQASRLREEAQQLLEQYRAEQESKLQEAEAMLASAKRDAAEMRERASVELKQAIDRRNQQAQEKVARAEAEAVEQIRARIVDAATDMARDIVAERLKGPAEEQAIARAIAAVERQIH